MKPLIIFQFQLTFFTRRVNSSKNKKNNSRRQIEIEAEADIETNAVSANRKQY